ncbi:hypothetical protein AA23498_0556 [Acetobacter nitrogenifigens DSM 23921 = NBRC 105050]|nr:hypothetical protein [Acetobacter nitrogenifigens]GBQ89161.1 hypothetical protein AA23498_0556 [Acetobacter nitrogenifigens DSM 23921 = NBRC 105050]
MNLLGAQSDDGDVAAQCLDPGWTGERGSVAAFRRKQPEQGNENQMNVPWLIVVLAAAQLSVACARAEAPDHRPPPAHGPGHVASSAPLRSADGQTSSETPESGLNADDASTEATDAGSSEEPLSAVALLDRPLFEPDRRPKGDAAQARGALRLTGIVGRDGRWTAIFHDGPADSRSKPRVVGQTINNWTVTAITGKDVTLHRDSETTSLAPTFLSSGAAPTDEKKANIHAVKILKARKTDPHLAW